MNLKTNFRYFQFRYLSISILFLMSGCSITKVDTFESIIEKISDKTYFLKQGKFNISRPFVIPSGIKVIGNNTTILINETHPFPIFQLKDVKNVEILNITIEGKPLTYSNNKDYLQKVNYFNVISINGCNNINLRKIKFKNIEGTGIKALDSERINIEKCFFIDFGHASFKDVGYSSDGIYLGGDKSIKSIKIDSCIFNNIGSSFPQGNPPWPNDGDGIQILSTGYANDITITNCEFDKCSSRAVKIQSGHNILVENNKISNGKAGVIMPMLNSISNIKIKNNVLKKIEISFGTDKGGEYCDALDLIIENNKIDNCVHFFRTSGYSNVRNGIIKNNEIEAVGQFVISGRFYNSEILSNTIGSFATENNPSWNMAILMSPESENVIIEGNKFGGNNKNKVLIDNRSKNTITLRNNSFSTH